METVSNSIPNPIQIPFRSDFIRPDGIQSFLGRTVESMSGLTAFGLTLLVLYASTKVLNFYEIGPNVYGSYVVFYIFLLIAIYNIPRYPLIK
jgi:hypothetical protein